MNTQAFILFFLYKKKIALFNSYSLSDFSRYFKLKA